MELPKKTGFEKGFGEKYPDNRTKSSIWKHLHCPHQCMYEYNNVRSYINVSVCINTLNVPVMYFAIYILLPLFIEIFINLLHYSKRNGRNTLPK